MRSLLHLCVCLVALMAARVDGGYPGGSTCSRTSDCRAGQCCRDRRGNLLGESDFGGEPLIDPSVRGRCSRRPSGPGQVCSLTCGCRKGYTCYRTITGACCPPRTCWTDEAAREDKEFWDNCFTDPNCALPPVAPPGK